MTEVFVACHQLPLLPALRISTVLSWTKWKNQKYEESRVNSLIIRYLIAGFIIYRTLLRNDPHTVLELLESQTHTFTTIHSHSYVHTNYTNIVSIKPVIHTLTTVIHNCGKH